MYEERTYRNLVKTDDLVNFEVIVKETDLLIRAEKDLSREARQSVLKYRNQLETYISVHPEFVKGLAKREKSFILILALDKILSLEELRVGASVLESGK